MRILQVIEPRERDLGGFVVRRMLPAAERSMVGPFIFFDHLGPAQFAAGAGIDVRPHPHIGLATVTYLFEGQLEHRDSLGNVVQIQPGDVNWMTAGRGIAHSERTPRAARAGGPRVHGIQSWVALPDAYEDVKPAFAHHPAASLPRTTRGDVELTILVGQAFGHTSPVAALWPTCYVHAGMPAGSTLAVPAEPKERAIYVVSGVISMGDAGVAAGRMAVLPPVETALRAVGDTWLMLLGGEPFASPRHLYWNFVASSEARIEAAQERWRHGRFPAVPGETEFIPLPP